MTSENLPERFCSHCGLSLIPLDRPHVARSCATCEKTVHVVEPGEGGKGIRVQAGDSFIIPAGSIKLSLDPAAGGRLFRHGVAFLAKQFIYSSAPNKAEDLARLLDSYAKDADAILKASEHLKDLDLDSEDGSNRALEILQEKKETRDWYALLLGSFARLAQDSLESGDARQAAWATYHATAAHSMTVILERTFEQTLWRGYLANRVVYEAASAASQTPGEAEALRELEPLFQRLDEATLHAWVESGLPVGPRIGVTSLPEELIVALAKFHLTGFQRRREDERRERDENRFIRDLRVKWTTVGIAATGAVVTLLKALGVL
jgi:hypothetical protein